MNLKNILLSFVFIFVITLVVSAVVSFLYSLIVYGSGEIDWENAA